MKFKRELSVRARNSLCLLGLWSILWAIFALICVTAKPDERYILILFSALGAGFATSLCFVYRYLALPYQKTRKLLDAFNKGAVFEELFAAEYPLSEEFAWTLEKLHQLLNSNETLKLSVEQSRYLALQNQINPHFLYNTLDAIRGDAVEAGIAEVAKTAEALSMFFGYTISNLDKYATLAEEIENVRDYITIQQYRFGDDLQLVVKNKDENREILECLMPRMTLQPLVENAIYHGLEEREKRGTVRILMQRTETLLIVNVVDDGVGMDTVTVDKLNAAMNRAESGYTGARQKRGGIAMKNVNSRIKLLFGEQYGLHIFSECGVGTDIRIQLPAVRKDEVNEKRVSENR